MPVGQDLGPHVRENGMVQDQVGGVAVHGGLQHGAPVLRRQTLDVGGLKRVHADRQQHVGQRVRLYVLAAQPGQTLELALVVLLQGDEYVPAGMEKGHEAPAAPFVVPGVRRHLRGHGLLQGLGKTQEPTLTRAASKQAIRVSGEHDCAAAPRTRRWPFRMRR